MAQVIRGSDLGQALSRGTVLADDGNLYDSVQEAENAASDWIFIGPATFNEAVTIDTAGLLVQGAGRDTLIDGGVSGHAIDIAAANVVVTNLSVQTTAGGGNTNRGIDTSTGADSGIISNVWVRDSDNHGIFLTNGADWMVLHCIVESADNVGITNATTRTIIAGCFASSTGNNGIANGGDDGLIAGCISTNAGNNGINSGVGNDTMIVGNRVISATTNGINIAATDQIVSGNRISSSGSDDINDLGTNTLVHGNRTGSAN